MKQKQIWIEWFENHFNRDCGYQLFDNIIDSVSRGELTFEQFENLIACIGLSDREITVMYRCLTTLED